MVKLIIIFILFAFYTNISMGQQAPSFSAAPKYFLDIQTGYADYYSVSVSGTIADFTYDVPLAIKFGASYNVRDAGDPWAARKIFINDNTNGDPEKSGHSFDLRVDFAYPVNWFPVRRTYLYAGPRLSFYTSSFEFIGGNEFFDIKTTQFGLGTGLEAHLGINQNLSFIISGAFDYFFDSEIGGHDTFYSPDGTDINGRNDYTYDDANQAINQPNYVVRLMVGLSFGL
ncbi:MAG: hypothetical protein OQK57_01240 [Ignavibacteriaceae bacterium]|nr:hypothetical protein [Ignavibacteriaceae bacterium]